MTTQQAVLFADVEGSTALYRALGDERAQQLIQTALERFIQATRDQGGQLIKTIGDEVMCRFPSAQAAGMAAIEMQRQANLPLTATGEVVRVRIGFAEGEMVERDNDVFGNAVNTAARLCSMAKGGQVLTTEATAHHLDRELRINTRTFDKTEIRGQPGEVTIVQIVWERRNATEIVSVGPAATSIALSLQLRYRDTTRALSPADLPLTLGRGDQCSLVIASTFASRQHARLEYKRGKFMLVDVSTNGTYVEVEDGAGARTVYIRDEGFALIGSGRFALGAKPGTDEHTLSYLAG